MGQFIIRTDFPALKNKRFYEKVKVEMERRGFKSEVSIKELIVRLPVCEFYIKGDYTTSQIIDSVKEALLYLKEEYSILVSEIQNIDGYNLSVNFKKKYNNP